MVLIMSHLLFSSLLQHYDLETSGCFTTWIMRDGAKEPAASSLTEQGSEY